MRSRRWQESGKGEDPRHSPSLSRRLDVRRRRTASHEIAFNPRELIVKIRRVLPAAHRILGETFLDDAIQSNRRFPLHVCQWRRCCRENLRHDGRAAVAIRTSHSIAPPL
jgi:hypothetical protein